jgi:hypothetical protein
MRDIHLDARFRLVTIPYRAFLHLLTVEDQRRALTCVRTHLADDGRLILNIFDPLLEEIAAQLGRLGRSLKSRSEFQLRETGPQYILWDSRRYDPERQILDELRLFEAVDAEGTVVKRFYRRLTLRYVFRYEMAHLLELCGFTVDALYGDFRRGPFRYGAEQVWVARKR